MNGYRWFVLDINPEPWAIGDVGVSRRNGRVSAYVGRNNQLYSYQEAVREAIGIENGMLEGKIDLKFFFWRNRPDYKTPNDRAHRKHEADLTNLQKATEDALQGILFKNDKDVNHIESFMVEQGPEVRGRVVIAMKPSSDLPEVMALLPDSVCELLDSMDGVEERPEQLRMAFDPKDVF